MAKPIPFLDATVAKARQLTIRALPLLRFGTFVADKIPTSDDTVAQMVAKGLAVADAALKARAHGDRFRDLVERYDLVEKESETFVKLFFDSDMKEHFRINRLPVGENETLVEAVNANGDRLAFRECQYMGRLVLDGAFFVSLGLNLDKVVDELWRKHPNGIYVSVVREPGGWKSETSVLDIPPVQAVLSQRAETQLETLTSRHRKFLKDGIHRCYLCLGPPGTGKSTFAVRFGQQFEGRTVKIDASSLHMMSVKDFGYLLNVLKPNTLIVDDMDRAPMEDVSARILFLMERLKGSHPKTAIILTVNDSTKLDSALLRSDRIDVPIEFPVPTKEENHQLVASLLHHYGVSPDLWEPIVKSVEENDLTHAYINDLCRRLRHEPLADVLESVRFLRNLSKKSAAAATPTNTPQGSGIPGGAPGS